MVEFEAIVPSVSAMGSGSKRAGSGRASGPFRAHARRNVRLRALLTHVQAGWQRYVPIDNLGLGGAGTRIAVGDGAVTGLPLAAGDAVTLSFTAPSLWDPLVLRARVAWVSRDAQGRVGLAFEHRPDAHEAVFALYELIVTLGFE
ncbi:MAG TPA: PilZ domain-containing protein [Elusimicrobiota bacterium]|nr:PilZ domain-containing protein [Elusimicrobiota bacterium]